MIKLILSTLFFLYSSFLFFQDDDLVKSIAKGKIIYEDFCVLCHKSNGTGSPNFFPPLANSDFLLQNRIESIRSIKYGQKGKIKVNNIDYNGLMPNPGLTDQEVADVMNYILNSWGNKGSKMVTIDEVKLVAQQ